MPVKLFAGNVWYKIRSQSYLLLLLLIWWDLVDLGPEWDVESLDLFPSGARPPFGPVFPFVKRKLQYLPYLPHRGTSLARPRWESSPLSSVDESWCANVVNECRMTLLHESGHLSPGNLCSSSLTFPQLHICPRGSASLGYFNTSPYSLVSQLLKN